VTAAVYSKCFMVAGYPAVAATYFVPAGFVAKLHNMSLWLRDSNTAGLPIDIVTVALDDPAFFIWNIEGTAARRGNYQWTGGEVFTNALYLAAPSGASYIFRANGVLLTLP
jgi:hypothetical protein